MFLLHKGEGGQRPDEGDMNPQRITLIFLLLVLLTSASFAAFPGSILCLLTAHNTPVHSDAIVLLAGAMKERAPTAAMLYRQGYAARVLVSSDGIFSSWSAKHSRNLYNVEWAEEELVKLGVPRSAIIKLPCLGSGTIYESMATRDEIEARGLRTIIVVTSDYHTRRAGWTFRHTLGKDASEVRTYAAQSEVGRVELFVEAVKLVYYRVRFGVLGLEAGM